MFKMLAGFGSAALLLHLLTNGRYGYFRDELYFMACGDHLAWGYVDFAPLAAWLVHVNRAILGDSLHALRFLPAVSAAAKIVLSGMIVRELGGHRFAILLACLCVLLAPVNLILDTLYSMNSFEPLFWMGCVYVLLVALRRGEPKLLLWFGLLAGLGLENKHSMAFFGIALVLGLLFTPARRLFANRWMWAAAALAFVIFLPNLIWQIQHHWPTLEDLANVRRTHKNVELPPLPFLWAQTLMLNPASVLVWLPGLAFLVFDPETRRYRFLGITYLVLLGLMMALHGKDYYLAPAYPMLFAAGGVFWEQWSAEKSRWLRIALPAAVALVALPTVPFVLPILPVDTFLRYQSAIGLEPPRTEAGHTGPLPQHFGDMFGWPEMVEKIAQVYNALPPQDRAKAAIYAGNYGEAGAVDFFGARYGLPKAISAHQTYFYWGPRQYTGEVMILLQGNRRAAEQRCFMFEDGPEVGQPYAMGEEHYQIFVCRGLRPPLQYLWPELKHWN